MSLKMRVLKIVMFLILGKIGLVILAKSIDYYSKEKVTPQVKQERRRRKPKVRLNDEDIDVSEDSNSAQTQVSAKRKSKPTTARDSRSEKPTANEEKSRKSQLRSTCPDLPRNRRSTSTSSEEKSIGKRRKMRKSSLDLLGDWEIIQPKQISPERKRQNEELPLPPGQFQTLMKHLNTTELLQKERWVARAISQLLKDGLAYKNDESANEKLLAYYVRAFEVAKDFNCEVVISVMNRNLQLMRKTLVDHDAATLIEEYLSNIHEAVPSIQSDINDQFSCLTAIFNPQRKLTFEEYLVEIVDMLEREMFSLASLLKYLLKRQMNGKDEVISLDLHFVSVDYAWNISRQAIQMIREGERLELITGKGEDSKNRSCTVAKTIRETIQMKFELFNQECANIYTNLGYFKYGNWINDGCILIKHTCDKLIT